MPNTFFNALKQNSSLNRTENGAVTRTTTQSTLYDLFALGGAYRKRTDDEVITLFSKALGENEEYALKCLFYLRDIRGGQGERRFFRVCIHWLACNHPAMIIRNLPYIAEFGRWDDYYALVDTPIENQVFDFLKSQFDIDLESKTPSLLGKWLKRENTSSYKSRILASKTRRAFKMTHKQYRQALSLLGSRINILETLMSQNRWDEIEFDKIPSKAGMIYKNAFARHDVTRERYVRFMTDKATKVNATTLYPYDVVHRARQVSNYGKIDVNDVERLTIQKYWDNLKDFFDGCSFNGLAIVDTSGSMYGMPIEVAISLGMYCAERAKGPFANHFMTFSRRPCLQAITGVDFVDKVHNLQSAHWGMNTNIEAAFDLMLNTAINSRCSQDDLPDALIVISDMEFDDCVVEYNALKEGTLFEFIERKWNTAGYRMPRLYFWNVDARHDNIPMKDNGNISFISGFSATLFEQVLKGVTGYDLMMDKLNSERYKVIA